MPTYREEELSLDDLETIKQWESTVEEHNGILSAINAVRHLTEAASALNDMPVAFWEQILNSDIDVLLPSQIFSMVEFIADLIREKLVDRNSKLNAVFHLANTAESLNNTPGEFWGQLLDNGTAVGASDQLSTTEE